MNYYERIQASIDFIEQNLCDDFTVEQAAQAAYMSVSTFYRMFLAIAGFTVKEYIRRRRLCAAAHELTTSKVIDVAVKYGYTNSDAFSRAFKKETGINPLTFKQTGDQNGCVRNQPSAPLLKRLHIMDQYFDSPDPKLAEEYPDIKILRSLPPMRTACFKYFGPNPEENAFAAMKNWCQKNGIQLNAQTEDGKNAYRIFGFNNPDPHNPEDSSETYGYEVCVTIDDAKYAALHDAPPYGEHTSYSTVMRKTLDGGKYAVVTVKREPNGDLGYAIMKAWQRFTKWMELSRFTWGRRQYLEEHLGFTDHGDHTGGVELYMPVQ